MALASGTRLGPYEIAAQIGVGGMGEVYRATDTKLKRAVAIKVLPPAVAADPERLARFQREAEVLASLNHPHIASIHGLEESEGVKALVMELVEGPTLADRITQGAIPLDEALAIAKQIAEALEAAHEQGIIHRDLKPANIKVREDGTVKVLDFGLAKAMEPVGATTRADASQLPTITTPAMTQAGVVLGTAAYMSPEQARGRPVDKRTDIWALGCVLYEMLTGRRAFDGDDVADTLANVLKVEPDWTRVRDEVPATIHTLIHRCLEKDRGKRLASASAALVLIDEAPSFVAAAAISAPLASGRRQSIDDAESKTRRELTRRWHRVSVITAVVSLVAGGMLGGWRASRAVVAPTHPVRRFPITLPSGVELPGRSGPLVALSPDGQTLVYGASEGEVWRLYRRSLNQLEPTAVPGSQTATVDAFFSPDSRWLGFTVANTVMKVALAGGQPVRITELGTGARGFHWAADDTIIAALGVDGLARFPANGGATTSIAVSSADGREFRWPQLLSDGRTILVTVSFNTPDTGDLVLVDSQTGTQRVLVQGISRGWYSPTGHIVFVREGAAWASRFDLEHLELVGDAAVVEQGIRVDDNGAPHLALAGDGTLAYLPEGTAAIPQRTLVWVERQGREAPINTPAHPYRYVRVSPDGSRVAVEIRERERDIWIWDVAREALTRLTFNSSGGAPVWSPDGTRIAFGALAGGRDTLIRWQSADGSGSPEPVAKDAGRRLWPRAFSPDGTRLLAAESTGPTDIHVATLGQGDWTPLLNSSAREFNPEVSPDGRWLAYQSDESGRLEVYVRPFPDVNSGRWQISTAGGSRPLWNRSGRELFYVAESGAMMAVPIESSGTSFLARRPELLFEGRYVLDGGGRTFDVMPDGRRFVMIKELESATSTLPPQVVVVENWGEELTRLLPAD